MNFIVRSSSAALFSIAVLGQASSAGADEPAAPAARVTAEAAADRPAVHAALKRSETAATDLTKSAAAPGNSGLLVLSGRGPLESKDARLATIGGTTTAQSNSGTNAARLVEAPKSEATVATVGKARRSRGAAVAAPAPGVERATAAMGPSLAACVKEADAGATGTAIIGATITSNGDATATSVITSGGLGGDSVACFRDVIVHANFGAQTPGLLQIRVSPQQLAALPPPVAATIAVTETAR